MSHVSISSSDSATQTRDAPVTGHVSLNANPVQKTRDLRNWHRHVLIVSIVIVALSLILQVRADQRVYVTGLSGLPVPETCGMQVMFGQSCPGCGLTRSFVYLAHGDWQRSFAVHRIGWIIALLVAFQIPYRLIAINYPVANMGSRWSWIIGISIGLALIANWFYNLMQRNGTLG